MNTDRTTHRRPLIVATTVLVVGVATSVAGNVQAINLDAADPGVGQHISAVFWPAMLFLMVELLLHTPWLSNWRDHLTKIAAVVCVAAVAGWVSYWHLAHVLSDYGYDVASRYAGPLAVDVAVGLATLALNRIGHARRGQALAKRAVASGQAVAKEDVATPEVLATQPTPPEWVAELEEWDVAMDLAIAAEGRDVARAAEAIANGGQGMDVATLPQRRPVPAEARALLEAWDPLAMSAREVDILLAGHFGKSVATTRRWRTAVHGPSSVSGPPAS